MNNHRVHLKNKINKILRTRILVSYFISTMVKFGLSEKHTKGPGAKKAMSKSPGYFYQILTFESRKGSPVATFESGNNKSGLSFFDFRLFHLQKQVLTQIVMF